MKSENYMNLEFPSRSANEAFARSAIACFAAQLDPTLDELGDIKTAVSEAVTNCIVHAYPETIGPVILRARLLPDNVLDIMVKDRGCGIADLEQACRPMFTTGGEERSGMGITIMESFMTEFRISSVPGKGTTVHMKRLEIAGNTQNSRYTDSHSIAYSFFRFIFHIHTSYLYYILYEI